MIAPFVTTGVLDQSYSLVVAVAIGIGFGFFLERAGFGSAKKLVSQFYLNDMAVFKVMFTAIITAMSGVYILSAAGFLDLGQVPLIGTYVVPQIVGGLILGAGFVIGGYCPGTSVVAVSTGKVDAVVYALGLLGGMFLYGEVYPLISGFVNSASMGTMTIPQYFKVPYLAVVGMALLIAFAGFYGAALIEKNYARIAARFGSGSAVKRPQGKEVARATAAEIS